MRITGMALAAIVCSVAAAASTRADDLAFCRELLDKSSRALGGEDKLLKLGTSTWKTKGKIVTNENAEVTFTDDWHYRTIDKKFRVDMDASVQGGSIRATFVFSGDNGWMKVSNNPKTVDIPKEYAAAIREGIHAARVVHRLPTLKDKAIELSPLGELRIGDRDAVGLRVIHKGHPDLSLFFDKQTHLPIKCEIRVTEGEQQMGYEFLYEDYKDFDGLKLYSKLIFKRDGKVFLESELSDLKPQEKLDDSLFDKP